MMVCRPISSSAPVQQQRRWIRQSIVKDAPRIAGKEACKYLTGAMFFLGGFPARSAYLECFLIILSAVHAVNDLAIHDPIDIRLTKKHIPILHESQHNGESTTKKHTD